MERCNNNKTQIALNTPPLVLDDDDDHHHVGFGVWKTLCYESIFFYFFFFFKKASSIFV